MSRHPELPTTTGGTSSTATPAAGTERTVFRIEEVAHANWCLTAEGLMHCIETELRWGPPLVVGPRQLLLAFRLLRSNGEPATVRNAAELLLYRLPARFQYDLAIPHGVYGPDPENIVEIWTDLLEDVNAAVAHALDVIWSTVDEDGQ